MIYLLTEVNARFDRVWLQILFTFFYLLAKEKREEAQYPPMFIRIINFNNTAIGTQTL
jgi:hypothetical protein